MNIHHMCTILLISMSWCVNLVRMGSIIILTHDAADPFLEVPINQFMGQCNFVKLRWN